MEKVLHFVSILSVISLIVLIGVYALEKKNIICIELAIVTLLVLMSLMLDYIVKR